MSDKESKRCKQKSLPQNNRSEKTQESQRSEYLKRSIEDQSNEQNGKWEEDKVNPIQTFNDDQDYYIDKSASSDDQTFQSDDCDWEKGQHKHRIKPPESLKNNNEIALSVVQKNTKERQCPHEKQSVFENNRQKVSTNLFRKRKEFEALHPRMNCKQKMIMIKRTWNKMNEKEREPYTLRGKQDYKRFRADLTISKQSKKQDKDQDKQSSIETLNKDQENDDDDGKISKGYQPDSSSDWDIGTS